MRRAFHRRNSICDIRLAGSQEIAWPSSTLSARVGRCAHAGLSRLMKSAARDIERAADLRRPGRYRLVSGRYNLRASGGIAFVK